MLYLNIQHGFLYMIIMQGSDMWRHVEPVPLTWKSHTVRTIGVKKHVDTLCTPEPYSAQRQIFYFASAVKLLHVLHLYQHNFFRATTCVLHYCGRFFATHHWPVGAKMVNSDKKWQTWTYSGKTFWKGAKRNRKQRKWRKVLNQRDKSG